MSDLRMVLLGCPGAGKGTQARILCEKYGLAHVATGDLLRAEIAAKSELGLKVADYLKKGTLVPDQVVVEMAAKKLDATPGGWLLDGFPRTLEQAQALDGYLSRKKQDIDLVLYLDVPEAEIVSRLTSRRSCGKCGEVFNVISRKPAKEGVCDKCGGPLHQREDDSEATVRKRMMVYEDLTRPLVSYYKSEHRFEEVGGARAPEAVTRDLAAAVDRALAEAAR